jgi:hypothetical protein
VGGQFCSFQATCSIWVSSPLGPINEPKKKTPSMKRKTCYDTMNMPASRPAIAHPVGTVRKASFSLVAWFSPLVMDA